MSMRGWWSLLGGGLVVLGLLAYAIARSFPSASSTTTETPPAAADSADAPPGEAAHITATLYFASQNGQTLVPLRRDVELAGDVVEQGRKILTAQLTEAPPAPYASVIPEGTMLRDFYITDRGDAFVDLSTEIVTGHPGGSLNELLTVYALVNAITANLPAVTRVQILVDGEEADTIAGHVDLRRPLAQDPSLVSEP
jgi:spore germination protein GerM